LHQFPTYSGRGIAHALALAAIISALSGCGDVYRYFKSGEVGWALKKELRDKHSKVVNIAKLTDFEWDELYLFSPYEPTDDICKRLLIALEDCRSVITSESTDDGEMLMVFRHTGKVVHTEMHIRWHGDFTPVPDEVFSRESAVFDVFVEGKGSLGQDRLVLRPKPRDMKALKQGLR
jgi:hypothetical protein